MRDTFPRAGAPQRRHMSHAGLFPHPDFFFVFSGFFSAFFFVFGVSTFICLVWQERLLPREAYV